MSMGGGGVKLLSFQLTNLGHRGFSQEVPVNLSRNNCKFYTCLPYLLEEEALSKEVISAIPWLQLRSH